ncbi:MAG: hypothetical protein ACRDIV_03390 [Ktedonobacteraceae bacterium]
MATPITVSKRLTVEASLVIERPEFAHWYGHGVWWAMYGDYQGKGLYADTYLIETTLLGIRNGWYIGSDPGWFDMLGFNLGMVHGGFLVQPTPTLVTLTDPDFRKGYFVGRDFCFNEAPLEGRVFSDTLFCEAVREWASEFSSWREPGAVLRYALGCRICELSGALIPDPIAVPSV